MEMSYQRGACEGTGWDGESNESVHERCGMGTHANGVNCRVVEWVKRSMLRWFGYIGRMKSEEVVRKKVYVSEIEDQNRIGSPLGRWKDRIKEYMCEGGATRRGWLKQTKEQ